MQHWHATSTGTIDYGFYKNKAMRLRRAARSRLFRRALWIAYAVVTAPVVLLLRLVGAGRAIDRRCRSA